MLDATKEKLQNGSNATIPPRGFTTTTATKTILTSFHNVDRPVKMFVDDSLGGGHPSLSFIDDESVKTPLRPDEVEIKALANTLDQAGIDTLLGTIPTTTSTSEFAGIITAVGSDLESFQIGDRVCGWKTDTVFSSQTRVKGSLVHKIPASWSFKMGAALARDASVAYYALSGCESGQTVLIHGASGLLGQIAALVANRLGLQIIATVKTVFEKQELDQGLLKPTHIFCLDDVALSKSLLELTGGTGVDIAVNMSSTVLSEELVKSVIPFGTIVEISHGHCNPITADHPIKHVSFSADQLLRHRPSIASNALKAVLALLPENLSDDFLRLKAISISDVSSIFEQAHPEKVVLLADDDTIVNVKESISPKDELEQLVVHLNIPQDKKESLLALIAQLSSTSHIEQPSPSNPAESKVNGISRSQSTATGDDFVFVPNELPKFPAPDIDAMCDAFLAGVETFAATPEEFAQTMRTIEEFKRPGSAGRRIYDRAVSRAADPAIENWEYELQLRRGYLDRRAALTPWVSFWFGHPISKRQHSQAERAALLSCAANDVRIKLEAGLDTLKPVVLNERELTTAFYPWIFNAVREPGFRTDEMRRYPNNDYCVALWKGHAYKVSLSVDSRQATYHELFDAFEQILNQSVERRSTGIFTADDRTPWAETRRRLQRLNAQNAASIATIEASAFTISLDEAAPETAKERARQFHFGGEYDAGNRWHDKTTQFVVCSNGCSGTLGEHSMLDAMTMTDLNQAIAAAIDSDIRHPSHISGNITPELLPIDTDADRVEKALAQYANRIKDAEHAYYLFEGYASTAVRAQKLPPKSVFQMIVQLASQSFYGGQAPPCFETVNQAHYHLGRIDIIQIINTQVAAFLAAAGDQSVSVYEKRRLLAIAARSHVAMINKSRRNLGWERNLTALRAMIEKGDEVPSLYNDPVYKRVRPRLIMSNCFDTGMMEKGCLWKDPKAVWLHYEVHDEHVYFSVVTSEREKATKFCEHLKDAAEVVRNIIFS